MTIYVKIDGVDGNATGKGHEKWIRAESVQWGVGRAIATPVGDSTDRECSEPSCSEVTFSKNLDAATAKLVQLATGERKGKDVQIDFTTTGKEGGEVYLTWKLKDALVSGHSSSSGGDKPSETVSLNYTHIEVEVKAGETTGVVGNPARATYDIAEGTSG